MDRREFLKRGAVSAAALALASAGGGCVACGNANCKGPQKGKMRLAVAGYTYNKFTLDETLKELEKFDIHYLCAKNFHFPYTATPDALKQLVAKSKAHGVTIYGAGPISMTTRDEAKRMFDYAAALGVETVVGVPGEVFVRPDGKKTTRTSRTMCECVSRLADEYKLNFAIHNHGANPKTGNPQLYPTCEATYNLVKDLSPRMGLCMDIAYTFADGYDPAAVIRRYADRLFDCHLRNIEDPKNGSSGTLAWKGKVNYREVFRALNEVGYAGCCGLELANAFAKKDTAYWRAGDPSWVPSCLGYFRGLMESSVN